MNGLVGTATTPADADPMAILDGALRRAILAALGEDHGRADPALRVSQNPQFGDYQANVAMSLAKQLGRNPRELAKAIVDAAGPELRELAEPIEVAGPGFINIRLRSAAIARLVAAVDNASLGVVPDRDPHAIVIDLCGVNVAKQMHVGHLRSTIIGDALARVFERRGRRVHRENHLGDWGLPIAMVLHHLRAQGADLDAIDLADLDRAYRAAQQATDQDEAALEAAKQTLVKLQNHDPDLVRDWHKLIDCTMRAVYESLDLLGVKLGPDNNRGESSYRDQLADVVDAFARSGVAQENEGALVVPFEDRERPLLIRKSDGGYLYATTDLAAVRHRVQTLGASRVIYVVDARQRDHFRDVFEAAAKIGWNRTKDGAAADLVHVPFGSVLGADKRPLKTRSGENVTLKSLLVEAIERGTTEVVARAADPSAPTHGLPQAELERIGRAVGIGAVKYADLSSDLVRDYVFNMDRMIAFEGRTGPYLQYAHARVCSIFARAGDRRDDHSGADFLIDHPAERALALALLRYGGVVADVARTLEPHHLCSYLYDLANSYSAFYQECPVLKAERADLRHSRLRLCDLVRRVLADGLDLLGIEAPQRM
jgi:arginyl-tRNA synthetase